MELLDYTLAPEVRAFSTPRTALSPAIETDAPYAGFNLTDYCGDSPAASRSAEKPCVRN